MGSSPLTRGKRGDAPPGPALFGLIPAHAGKTCASCAASTYSAAHPRSRGENTLRQGAGPLMRGSSPLTRGKQQVDVAKADVLGLIPAHAGKTATRHTVAPCPWAHPRSRGENVRVERAGGQGEGSSPLTRGKLLQHQWQQGRDRLIPAHAGKTWWRTAAPR